MSLLLDALKKAAEQKAEKNRQESAGAGTSDETVVDAAASGLAGFVGLFSCVSCTWPLLATVFTGIFGTASAAASIVTGQPYGASTVVFLASVAMLVWRPTR